MSRLDVHRYANEAMVVDLPDGTTIVLSHPGQPLVTDPKVLKQQHGLDPATGFLPSMIVPLSESRARPLTDAEKAAERAQTPASVAPTPKTAREAELEADSAKKDALIKDLMAQLAPKTPKG